MERGMERRIREARFLKALKKRKYWTPSFSMLSKDLKMPVSSAYDLWHRLDYRVVVKVEIVSDLDIAED